MRYEATFDACYFWSGGVERSVSARTSTLTVTRRGATMAFRLVRGHKKVRWARAFESVSRAQTASATLERVLKGSVYKLRDGEDIKIPPPDLLEPWKDACVGARGDDARLVYADVLSEMRDPRGELIVAQSRAEDDETASYVVERILREHRIAFLGPLVDHADRSHIRWRRGFIDSLVLDHALEEDTDCAGLLVEVLTHPSGELLRALTIDIDSMAFEPTRQTVAELTVLLAALAPRGLEALTIQSERWRPYQPTIGDVSGMLASLATLTRFTAAGVEVALHAPFEAPSLVKLSLTAGIGDADCAVLVASSMPRLEKLLLRSPAPLSWAMTSALTEKFSSRLVLETGDPSDPIRDDDSS